MINWKENYKQFKAWQQQPYQVKPLLEQEHVCTTCGTSFEGNYCPRCGQSSRIGRYSAKNTFLLLLDVWGVGNRSMFRTLRDLILRPGYMIRDYLQGMQMAYFPPFKMFFLLIALLVIVQTGLNIKGINCMNESLKILDQYEQSIPVQGNTNNTEQDKPLTAYFQVTRYLLTWVYKHRTVALLVSLLPFSFLLYWFFRCSPTIPDMKFSEFFVSMVYITNMTSIYSIVCSFFCGNYEVSICLLAIIPLKQLFGYSYWCTIWRFLLTFIPYIIILFCLIYSIGFIYVFFTYN